MTVLSPLNKSSDQCKSIVSSPRGAFFFFFLPYDRLFFRGLAEQRSWAGEGLCFHASPFFLFLTIRMWLSPFFSFQRRTALYLPSTGSFLLMCLLRVFLNPFSSRIREGACFLFQQECPPERHSNPIFIFFFLPPPSPEFLGVFQVRHGLFGNDQIAGTAGSFFLP